MTASTDIFRDPTRPLHERVQDLLTRLTLPEKIGQMGSQAQAIPRLGIPAYHWWSEGLHGVARNGRATVFPQAIGMAATWDPALIRDVASAIGDEARAKHHEALRRNGYTRIYQGLTFWSPNVNIFRDPRWGRGQETWGEDPHLTGEMGAAFVRGLQGDDPRYLKVAACAKHYAVHSGPESKRHGFNVEVSPRDLHGTYLPAFRKLVTEAGVEAVMGAYNRVNGEPCCASPTLLTAILRESWGFTGHVVSDCGALSDIHTHHHAARDAVEAAALALRAGCDLNCGSTYERLGEAIARGLASEADVDHALARTLATRFKLGMFDPPRQVPYASVSLDVVGCAAHRDLAYRAALESVVLLKNRDRILPIRESTRTISIVGPNAGNVDVLLGSYHGASSTLTTVIEGLMARVPEGVRIEYRYGTPLTQRPANQLNWSVNECAAADITIACMGITPFMEGEEGDTVYGGANGDRTDIGLPEAQLWYLRELARAGAKVVLILFGGSPLALGDVAEMMAAIVYAWYPGQEGGRALADILFGDAAPSGKLPVTFPQSTAQLPPFEDYSMEGRTYRYMAAEPLYPFGFGLSYTTFSYRDLRLDHATTSGAEPVAVRVTVANTGAVAGEEVAQLYISPLARAAGAPLHTLAGFRRLRLGPGEERDIEFRLEPGVLGQADEAGQPLPARGQYRLSVGGCSPSRRGLVLGAPLPAEAVVRLI